MKNSKLYAFLFAAAVMASAAAGCSDSNSDKNEPAAQPAATVATENLEALEPPVEHGPAGENQVEAEIGAEVNANDTGFTLNGVIDGGHNDDGTKCLYFDITLRNETDTAYTLSTLNNFYIIDGNGEEIYSDVRSQLYANKNFNPEKYFADPFDIPSNGQFSGVIGGYTVDQGLNEFTLCFFPTGNDPRAKETVFQYHITEADIKAADSSLKK